MVIQLAQRSPHKKAVLCVSNLERKGRSRKREGCGIYTTRTGITIENILVIQQDSPPKKWTEAFLHTKFGKERVWHYKLPGITLCLLRRPQSFNKTHPQRSMEGFFVICGRRGCGLYTTKHIHTTATPPPPYMQLQTPQKG